MKHGWRFKAYRKKAFLSVYALCVLTLMLQAGYIPLHVSYNLLKTKQQLKILVKQIYLECLVMQRIKYACDSMDYDESILSFDDWTVSLSYDFDDVTAIYERDGERLIRLYQFDLNTRTLTMITTAQ